MVEQKYRWDFIGLSTDEKPTPATSPKVVDGSTFYCSDNSKLYVWCKTQWYERKPLGGGGGGGSYTAGTGIDITDDTISVDTTTIQEKLTAGTNVTISDNTISATDTTYSNFTGTDGTSAGTAGLVPAPATTDAGKFLKADGTWDTAGGGSGPTVVQTPGDSTTDVMSQDAVTSMIFADPSTRYKIKIGDGTSTSEGSDGVEIGHYAAATANNTVAIGYNSKAEKNQATALGYSAQAKTVGSVAIGDTAIAGDATGSYRAVAVGQQANAKKLGSVAIGSYSVANSVGEFNIGSTEVSAGYNSTNYRLLSGVYDGQDIHDAATLAQGNTLATSAPTTSTVGVLGQLYTDTTNMHTYQCTAISGDTYTWTQRW